ncbi:septal ring lytic transglycosylase RlpA family protein [Bradyrhizobium sp. 83012]|uniref:Endolytic peptidoglycan transglycosylase RlpA n=1 Tax=Bradyrhizobium aeschynomenes TaxID=2734909 RepID=A0ABX2CBH7_9BRAD|nr:septal ring lytic transglycosylase RlpA family protein [Bradyrhizobium aeschynomenes]NPU65568.1 septal ring lytic transglycosylase RlpA family protein [Bradyrhizobium aeschynomenes]
MRIIDRTERRERQDAHNSIIQAGTSGLSRQLLRVALVCAAAASLAACAQSSAVRQARSPASAKQAAAELRPPVQRPETAPESLVRVRHAEVSPPAAHSAASGLASYYSEGQKTASGERFNPSELTAAHRSLPFGTRLQVTNVKTGRSVVVRVNDRGPFVQGRVVDVSYSAAQALGMVNTGVAPVKVSVVR